MTSATRRTPGTERGAKDRMARLIAAIPWIVAQDGALVDEICSRFDYDRDLLLKDLGDVVFFVGVPPYTPDTLIEVTIDDDMVWISYADWFSRPMKLSGGELLGLLTAGETALSFDNQDEAGALARGLAKLRLASGSGDAVEVEISGVDRTLLPGLRQAADTKTCVDIDYYSFSSNSKTNRRIEPDRFSVVDGAWYVGAYCHVAKAERVFRVDRIESLALTNDSFSGPHGQGEDGELFSLQDAPRATIAVPMDRVRMLDGLPLDDTTSESNEVLVVTLPASSQRWLESLLVRLGPGAELRDPSAHEASVSTAASRVLSRYGVGS